MDKTNIEPKPDLRDVVFVEGAGLIRIGEDTEEERTDEPDERLEDEKIEEVENQF